MPRKSKTSFNPTGKQFVRRFTRSSLKASAPEFIPSSSLNPSAQEFIMPTAPAPAPAPDPAPAPAPDPAPAAEREDSGKKHPNAVHYQNNCASSFQSLALHLTKTMNPVSPNKSKAIEWITNCIDARVRATEYFESIGQTTDQAHADIIDMLKRLRKYILDKIENNEGVTFEFRERPEFRFLIRTSNQKEATIYFNRVANKLQGGRKSTRKNRKRNRKTYRILPRVEGS